MDFVDEPANSSRRTQAGIYTDYYLPGDQSDHDIHLILLDVRYHKHGSMGHGDMLGEEQWQWLEKVLAESPSRFHIIGSGVQVTPFQKPVQEAWSSHPHSRQRLFNLLAKYRVPGAIFISGDVHYSEVLKVPAKCSGTGYPVYEFTSSGMTHSCNTLLGFCRFVLDNFFMTPYHHDDSFYVELNWGSIEFDWHTKQIKLSTHDVAGKIVHQSSIGFNTLLVPKSHDPSQTIDALTKCDGAPNWFLLIPFETWKYALFLIPLSIIIIASLILRYLIRFFFASSKDTSPRQKPKRD